MIAAQTGSKSPQTVFRRKLAELLEFFTLREVLAQSRTVEEKRRAPARPKVQAARERLSGADVLWARGKAVPALDMYREAALLFAAALAMLAGLEDLSSQAPVAQFEQLSRLLAAAADYNSRAARAWPRLHLLALTQPIDLAGLAGPEGNYRVSELADAVHWLAEQVNIRTPSSVQLHRALRGCIALVIAAGLSVGILSWAMPPVDLALEKPVTASSHAYETTPHGAVDGIRYGQLGFHSGNDAAPWLCVDLGQVTTFHEVRVFGRPECCYEQSIPLALEISKDGVAFREIALRTEPFTQYEPWVVRTGSIDARYVRLHTLRHSYLVTSELEIY
jgi:hypothetical protein